MPSRFGLTYLFLVLAVVGSIFSFIGAAVNPHQFAYSWFFAFYYFFTIALGGFFWVTLHYACDSNWSVLPRRVWEHNAGPVLPLFFVLFLPLLWPDFRDVLWTWMSPAHATDHEVEIRSGYLNPTFFYIRVFIYFFYFCLAGLYYRLNSVAQDIDGNPVLTRRMHDYMLPRARHLWHPGNFSMGFDWLMGLDWHWFSSLFGVYNFTICVQGQHGRWHRDHRDASLRRFSPSP